MTDIAKNMSEVRKAISRAEQDFGRPPGSVSLLAVSKAHPAERILQAASCGQRHFGESYVQEGVEKICSLGQDKLVWHFIGPIQSNKTRLIAEHFSWVHSLDRSKVAARLNEQRPSSLPPLQICLQVNISNEPAKGGVALTELPALADTVNSLPQLRLRGLMAIPQPCNDFERQRKQFAAVRNALIQLNQYGHRFDTLSMGMSNDMRAAIAEGATMVRIGTAIFGPRPKATPS